MPIEIALWKMGRTLQRIDFCRLDAESRLEDVLADDLALIDPGLLLIGRQVPTAQGNFVDLLALDADANLVVIELKRSRTPRDIVAQLLDYGSWVRTLTDQEIASIYSEHLRKHHPDRASTALDQAFCGKFGVEEMPESLNDSHELVLVAGELDDSTERIIGYLSEEYGVAINAVFFRFFRDGESEYLTRAWLIDPAEAEAKAVEQREKLPWNGEFYVSFGANPNRDWEEARKYGFVSAGGGSWYTKTLQMLEKGTRIWVNVPGSGYVGVGRVIAEAVPLGEFTVRDGNGKRVRIGSLAIKAANLQLDGEGPEKAEHFVGVEWIQTVPLVQAIKEKGFFGNQNSAAKPRSKKWVHTIERLKVRFGVHDSAAQ